LLVGAPLGRQVLLILSALRKECVEMPVIAIVDQAADRDVEQLLEHGATDFLLHPVRPMELLSRARRWIDSPRRTPERSCPVLIGESAVWLREMTKIATASRCNATVLITGETGTGKELCARALHDQSDRRKRSFVAVNCGALPPDLIENELFGHEAGAFTSAVSSTAGLIRESEGGTLFLDEVDSMSPAAQVKLLRFLQEKEYRPVGSKKTYKADVRVVAATNSNLEQAVEERRFRRDLLYRLDIIRIRLPPLRERGNDVLVLAKHFLAKLSREFGCASKHLDASAAEQILSFGWPGNVRQLEHALTRAVVTCAGDCIASEDLDLPSSASGAGPFRAAKAAMVAEFERRYIQDILATHNGNVSRAAVAAGKNRRAFWELMRKHGIRRH
jgi:two-component system, NtrC family, response regulator GlrR